MSTQFESFPIASQPTPKPHQVDVWLLDTQALPMMVAQGAQPTSGQTSLNTQARDRRIRQQFVMRLLLAAYLDRPGKDIKLSKDDFGKPHIANEALTINWSHSQDWLAVAIGHQQPLGIDVELKRPIQRAKAIAKRCFSSEEAHALSELHEPQCSEVFLKRWTKTEALVKAQGEGLAKSLSEIRFSYPTQTLMACPKHWPSAVNWHLSALEFDAPVIGALASSEPILSVHIKQLMWG